MVELEYTIHPGEMLQELFLIPLDLTAAKFADSIKLPVKLVEEIIEGSMDITADTALRLAKSLGTTPEMWMNMQSHDDLFNAKKATDLADVEIVNHRSKR
jgi:addiction module HigA family antidote